MNNPEAAWATTIRATLIGATAHPTTIPMAHRIQTVGRLASRRWTAEETRGAASDPTVKATATRATEARPCVWAASPTESSVGADATNMRPAPARTGTDTVARASRPVATRASRTVRLTGDPPATTTVGRSPRTYTAVTPLSTIEDPTSATSGSKAAAAAPTASMAATPVPYHVRATDPGLTAATSARMPA